MIGNIAQRPGLVGNKQNLTIQVYSGAFLQRTDLMIDTYFIKDITDTAYAVLHRVLSIGCLNSVLVGNKSVVN